MKNITKFIALLLCLIIVASPLTVAYAGTDTSGFVLIDVTTYTSDGNTQTNSHAFYSDGEILYASVPTFEEYTFYEFDEKNSAFVRSGQIYQLALSRVTIDFENKKATVKMMNGEKQVNLKNVFRFGNNYYLPLDQICGLLMSKVTFDNDCMIIENSGFSIVDASYGFSNYAYCFNYNDIVDGIFLGNEDLYFAYCIVGFFGSSIFGLRYKNLDVITNSGDIEYYEEILFESVTDNSVYLKYQASEDEFLNGIQDATKTCGYIKQFLNTGKNTTTVSEKAYSLFEDTEDVAQLDCLYIDVKNWNEVFGALADFISYAEYFTKVLSMNEDHQKMLKVCADNTNIKNAGFELNTAIINTYIELGKGAFATISSKVADELLKNLPEKIIEGSAAKVALPYIAVIKAVDAAFKLLGYDLSDNSQYSIMLETLVVSHFAGIYSNLLESAGETIQDSADFRRSAIMMLLCMKHAFESGNKLDKSLDGNGTLFDDEISEICARLNMFYLAAESAFADSIEGVEKLVSENRQSISDSGVLMKAKPTEQPTCSSMQARESDFDYLVNLIYEFTFFKKFSYNYEKETALQDALNILIGSADTAYNCYFTSGEALRTPDPLKIMYGDHNWWEGYGYGKYPAENVDWILKNIFNTEPDHTVFIDGGKDVGNEKDIYFHKDYYYSYAFPNGTDAVYHAGRVSEWSVDSDGRYVVDVEFYESPRGEYVGDVMRVVASLEKLNGKREWSFYSLEYIENTDDSVVEDSKEEPETYTNKEEGYLAATEEDLEQLKYSAACLESYNSDNDENITAAHIVFLYLYNDYFDRPKFNDEDPLNLFDEIHKGNLMKYPAENVDWIITNILNSEPEHSSELIKNYYCPADHYYYDGYYYVFAGGYDYGDWHSETVVMDSCEVTDEGKYVAEIYYGAWHSEGEFCCRLKVVAALKKINGERVWTFFKADKEHLN